MIKTIAELQAELDNRGEYGCVDTKSRLVIHDDETIYIYLKNHKVTEYASYTPELYYLLACPCYCSYDYSPVEKRAKVEVGCALLKTRCRCNLGRMILLWYRNERCVEDFVDAFPEIIEANKVIDTEHLNSDIHNHCTWNLTGATRSENRGKGDHAAHIKPPYFCYYAITADRKYRVCFGYKTDFHWGQTMYIQFATLGSLTDFLRSVMKMSKATAFVRRYGTPTEVYKADPKAVYAAQNFQVASHYAKQLISMDDDAFMKWGADHKIVVQ